MCCLLQRNNNPSARIVLFFLSRLLPDSVMSAFKCDTVCIECIECAERVPVCSADVTALTTTISSIHEVVKTLRGEPMRPELLLGLTIARKALKLTAENRVHPASADSVFGLTRLCEWLLRERGKIGAGTHQEPLAVVEMPMPERRAGGNERHHCSAKTLAMLQRTAGRLSLMHKLKPPIEDHVVVGDSSLPAWIDFDFSFRRVRTASTVGVTDCVMVDCFAAPEVLKSKVPLDAPSQDIYSFGVVMFEVLTGALPWDVATFDAMRDVAHNVNVAEQHFRIGPEFGVPPQIVELVVACAQHDPARRPSATDVAHTLHMTKAEVLRCELECLRAEIEAMRGKDGTKAAAKKIINALLAAASARSPVLRCTSVQ